MGKRVILRKHPRNVSGRMLKPGQECTLPDELARSLENKGLCTILVSAEATPAAAIEIKAAAKPKRKPKAPPK